MFCRRLVAGFSLHNLLLLYAIMSPLFSFNSTFKFFSDLWMQSKINLAEFLWRSKLQSHALSPISCSSPHPSPCWFLFCFVFPNEVRFALSVLVLGTLLYSTCHVQQHWWWLTASSKAGVQKLYLLVGLKRPTKRILQIWKDANSLLLLNFPL